MKKATSPPRTVDEYLERVPEPAHTTLTRIRATIRSAAPPEATEAISYQMPVFKYKGMLFGYAAFANHCSLFPMGSQVITQFRKELAKFETAKGTIRFPVDKPPSAALIRKMVKARVAMNEQKKK